MLSMLPTENPMKPQSPLVEAPNFKDSDAKSELAK